MEGEKVNGPEIKIRRELKVSGFGGQGVILAGHIIGKAATIHDGKNATLTQAYGPEARGGACSADLIISNGEIDYPEITAPYLLVAMSQEAYKSFSPSLRDHGRLLIDEDLVKIEELKEGIKLYSIPATRIAEELGRKIIANIVMLGFLTSIASIVSYEGMKDAVLSSVPKGTEKLNIEAFERGYKYGLEKYKKKSLNNKNNGNNNNNEGIKNVKNK